MASAIHPTAVSLLDQNNNRNSWRTLFRHWRARVGPVAGDGLFRHRPLPRRRAGHSRCAEQQL